MSSKESTIGRLSVSAGTFSTLAASTSTRIATAPVFVDVSEQSIKSNIVREGYQVPAPEIDITRVGSVLDQLIKIQPKEAARVVRQSVPPGVKIAPGAAVDLVMAPRSIIPIEIFANVHEDLRLRTVAEVGAVLDDSAVRNAVLKTTNPADLSTAERDAVRAAATTTLGIVIDDAVPEKSFDRVFSTLRSTAAFR